MKGRFLWFLILAIACCWIGQVQAQQADGLSRGNLKEKFDYMLNESSRYQSYKVVPQTWLNTFWKHVQDTLSSQQGLIKQNEVALNAKNGKIETLKKQEEALIAEKESLQQEKDSLSFLGFSMNKAIYHTLVWAIIAALLAGMLFFLGRFRLANTTTRRVRADNQELQTTVDQQRKRMLEKEQTLRRQLQDEINKRSR